MIPKVNNFIKGLSVRLTYHKGLKIEVTFYNYFRPGLRISWNGLNQRFMFKRLNHNDMAGFWRMIYNKEQKMEVEFLKEWLTWQKSLWNGNSRREENQDLKVIDEIQWKFKQVVFWRLISGALSTPKISFSVHQDFSSPLASPANVLEL